MGNCKLPVRIMLTLAVLMVGMAMSPMAQAQRERLSREQKQHLKTLAMETRSRTETERENLRRARMELFNVYQGYSLDERKAKAAQNRISTAQLDLLNSHLDNQIRLRAVLSREQFLDFRRLIERHRGRGMGGLGPPEDAGVDRLPDRQMLENLGLRPDQRKRAAALGDPMRDRAKLIEALRRASKQMIDIYGEYDLDKAAAKKLIEQIHRGQGELAALTHKEQQALRSVLTPTQFAQLKDLTARRIRQHRPAGRRR